MRCAASRPTSKPGRPQVKSQGAGVTNPKITDSPIDSRRRQLSHRWRCLQQVQELEGMLDVGVCAPFLRRFAVPQVAVQSHYGCHSRGVTGLDVALVVADVDAVLWLDAEPPARLEQRVGKGFGAGGRVSADYAPGASRQAERRDQRQSKAL